MKASKLFGILMLGSTLASTYAYADEFADGQWHSVISCESGAAVVDNRIAIGRGGSGSQAQIVIHDQNIISYFNKSGAIKSEYGAVEWIGKSLPAMQTAGTLLSFDLSADSGSVYFDGSGLLLKVGGANWFFRNCVQK